MIASKHRSEVSRRLLTEGSPAPALQQRIGGLVRGCLRSVKLDRRVSGLDDARLGARAVFAAAGGAIGARFLPGTSLGRYLVAAAAAAALAGWLERRDTEASAEIAETMPDVLDRMAVCALAGSSVSSALRIVAERTSGAVGRAMRRSVGMLDAGAPLQRALDQLLEGAAGTAWAGPVAAIERAAHLGVPLSDALVAQAREQRSQARALLEARARAAPVKVVFPLVFCFLPAFLILAVGPVAISAIRTLTAL